MEASFWDSRYADPERFAYGEAPNAFVAEAAGQHLKVPSNIVELASGEGRNAVYLAQAGWGAEPYPGAAKLCAQAEVVLCLVDTAAAGNPCGRYSCICVLQVCSVRAQSRKLGCDRTNNLSAVLDTGGPHGHCYRLLPGWSCCARLL
jgi:hypothetical protein